MPCMGEALGSIPVPNKARVNTGSPALGRAEVQGSLSYISSPRPVCAETVQLCGQELGSFGVSKRPSNLESGGITNRR